MKTSHPIDRPEKSTTERVRVKLDTLIDIRREASAVYRLAKGGQLPIDTARGLAAILKVVGNLICDSELEARLAALEGDER